MKRIRNLLYFSGDSTLGVRLGVCFALLIAMLVAIGALGLRQLRQLDKNLEEIVNQEWVKVQLSKRAQSYSNLNSRITMQVFIMDDQEEIKALLAQRTKNSAEISNLIETLSRK